MEPTYRIAKWLETFEKSDSKRYKTLPWISVPTSFTSNGYQAGLDEFEDDWFLLYGAWQALCMFAATCPVRGTLASGRNAPIPISRIARVTGASVALMERLFEWASRQDIGWLEVVPSADAARVSPERQPSEQHPADPSGTRATPEQEPQSPPERRPSDDRKKTELRNERNERNVTDGRTDAGACVRATVGPAAEGPAAPDGPIVIDAERWEEARPLMRRIASVVDPGWSERNAGRLKPHDRRLCWTVAALARWQPRLGEAWLEGVLEPIASRKEPPPNRWGYFRGALITATTRLGLNFHDLEKLVELAPEIAEREAARPARKQTAGAAN